MPTYWKWEDHKECFREWGTGKSLQEMQPVLDAVAELAQCPLDTLPGEPAPNGRSDLYRAVRVNGTVIEFTVCRPLVRDLLLIRRIYDN